MSDKKLATFDDDCFDRKDFAKNLCNLIKGQEGYQSRVISIKADFGYGKTFFAEAFKNMIDSQDPHISPSLYCHYIDIWKEDYNHKPLLALLSSLNEFVKKINIISPIQKEKLEGALKIFSIETAKEVMSYIPLTKGLSKAIESFYSDEKSIFKDLNALKNIAELVQEAFAGFENTSKMIIIIDEIDRCHPEYAIEFLETLKHFFDLKNLYFILMMNENHLREKVKSKFGYIDFDMWKDKFINLEFELPNTGSQEKFIDYLIKQKYKIQDCENVKVLDFEQKSLNKHMDFNVPPIKPPKDSCLIFFKEKQHQWKLLLGAFLTTTHYTLNNRQLDSIFLNLKIALDTLGHKPIFPTLLLGIILKNYIRLEKMTLQGFSSKLWFHGNYTKNKEDKELHALQFIFKLKPKIGQQSVLFFEDKRHLISLTQEQVDNILAAQFASQASKV